MIKQYNLGHFWLLILLSVSGCGSAVSRTVAPATSIAVETPIFSASSTPVRWPLLVQLTDSQNQSRAIPESLFELVPGTTTLHDLYAQVGYPGKRKDFPSGIALLYPSLWVKDPNIVLVDGQSGEVLLVAIENMSKPIFSLEHLKAQYGEPALMKMDGRSMIFFANFGIAAIMYANDPNSILYLHVLPKNTSLEDYQAHHGYQEETFSFVP